MKLVVAAVACVLAASLVALAAPAAGRTGSSVTDPCIQPGETPVRMKTRDGVALYGLEVGTGEFGAHMTVEIQNDGPVTLILERNA